MCIYIYIYMNSTQQNKQHMKTTINIQGEQRYLSNTGFFKSGE